MRNIDIELKQLYLDKERYEQTLKTNSLTNQEREFFLIGLKNVNRKIQCLINIP